jgi:recombination protein RecT
MATHLAEVRSETNFPALLERAKSEIERALPRHLDGDRMARIALTSFRRNPALGSCDPKSVLAAVIQASQLGLEPDTLGRSYLIPYGRECQFIPGWKGLTDLVHRSGIATVWTGAVYDGDVLEYGIGDSPYVLHKPTGACDPAKLTHVYAVARMKGVKFPIVEVWTVDRVNKHRDRYNKVGKKHYSFAHPEMYARKVVLLQVIKYLPASPELATAIDLNDQAELGEQNLSMENILEGSCSPVTETPPAKPKPVDTRLRSVPTEPEPASEPLTDAVEEPAAPAPPIPVISPAKLEKLTIILDELDLDPPRVTKYAQKIASIKGIPMRDTLADLPLEMYDFLLKKLPDLAKAQVGR